ncbi:MAG TPA: hypothetical protein VLG49_00145 [Rhabdochlamydiaceae bacterium]|nr:hypothetical protein [Rhabdochlamydiaceae bacterium]
MSNLCVPVFVAETCFQYFPSTFCNYDRKLVLDGINEQDKNQFYVVIAEKVAQLYATSMRSPVRFGGSQSNIKELKEEEIETFRKTLNDYISEKLLNRKSVTLITEKVPQSELKSVLEKCNINLESEARNEVFYLPSKSFVSIDTYVQDNECNMYEGLDIIMQRV